VARSHWGRGIATEGAAAVIAYAFDVLGLHRVFATVDTRNAGSMRVLQKLGMREEGILRKHRFYSGEYADEAHYAILAEEYAALSH
jgi:RimJ/RimL family protein N-acetyltransferase